MGPSFHLRLARLASQVRRAVLVGHLCLCRREVLARQEGLVGQGALLDLDHPLLSEFDCSAGLQRHPCLSPVGQCHPVLLSLPLVLEALACHPNQVDPDNHLVLVGQKDQDLLGVLLCLVFQEDLEDSYNLELLLLSAFWQVLPLVSPARVGRVWAAAGRAKPPPARIPNLLPRQRAPPPRGRCPGTPAPPGR